MLDKLDHTFDQVEPAEKAQAVVTLTGQTGFL